MFLTATGHRLNINSRGNFQPSLCVDPDDPHFRSEKFNEGLEIFSRSIVTVFRSVQPWHQIDGSITAENRFKACSVAVLWQAFLQKFFNAERGTLKCRRISAVPAENTTWPLPENQAQYRAAPGRP
jgi:hypothetical protein